MEEHDEGFDGLRLVVTPGGLWRAAPVREQPHAVLHDWQVHQLDNGDRHLVGWCEDQQEGRVTSRIVAFDAATRSCKTQSGRVYALRGPAGWNGDAQYVWARWQQLFRVQDPIEVSAEVEKAIAEAAGARGAKGSNQ
ncbi:hypothetical protein DES47_11648 [Roseateles toxinivorans]|uniref:Uncharacterized protein n=2 Tax=Roseateles toxinivorans TaxID=270368 RepID=A0A4R6QCS7_9BURK|nr:hypothetical protein DES47_11648 [Roseateles toxinivorans]